MAGGVQQMCMMCDEDLQHFHCKQLSSVAENEANESCESELGSLTSSWKTLESFKEPRTCFTNFSYR